MAIIKHRPRIRLMLAPELQPGETFVARVIVEARREVDVDYIEVDLEGTEERSIGSGQYQMIRRRDICYLRARVTPSGTLPKGRSEYRCRFSLPADAPPTYSGSRIRIWYLMNVRAFIPWWPDARASFEVNVGPSHKRKAPDSKPILFSSQPEGPSANEPHIEGSLTSDVLSPGGVVSGAIALSNVAYTRYAGLRLSLVGVEWVKIGSRQSDNEAHRYEIHMPLDKPVEGEPNQFRMRLPAYVPPSYRDRHWSLSWYFECKAHIRWAQDMVLRLPVDVVPKQKKQKGSGKDRGQTSSTRTRHAPPTVGSERIQALWRQIAEAHGLEFDSRRIHGRVAGSDLTVVREHRGSGGVFLVGTLSYAPLHLGLEIEPKKGWLRVGSSGIRLGGLQWDRDHQITCRDSSQLTAMASSLRRPLTEFRTVRMSDDRAIVELRNAGASKSRLNAFVRDLSTLARSISVARGDIPPPQKMREHADEWRELARVLDGALETARMHITGSMSGMTVSVRTAWHPDSGDGKPMCTVIEARPPMAIADSHHVNVYEGATDDELIDELDNPPPAAQRSLEDAQALEISAESIEVTLPAITADPKQLIPRLRALCDWARQLSAAAGPYR